MNSRCVLRISYAGPLPPSEHNNVNCGDNLHSQYFPELRRKFARACLTIEIQQRFANRGEMMRIGEDDDDDDWIATMVRSRENIGDETLRICVVKCFRLRI